MKIHLRNYWLILAVLLADSCASGRYYTFAWLPPADSAKNFSINDTADHRLREAITTKLEQKGFLLHAQRPDLLVRYTLEFNHSVKAINDSVYNYTYRNWYPRFVRYHDNRYFFYDYTAPFPVYLDPDIKPVTFTNGMLIIDLIDRKTQHVIWRCSGPGEKSIPNMVDQLPLTPVH